MVDIDMADWQIGQEIPITFQAVDADGIPAWPTTPPMLTLYNSDGFILTRKMPSDNSTGVPGLFRMLLRIGYQFAVGQVFGFIQWTSGADLFQVPVYFRLIPGGDPVGAVIAMTSLRRPSASYIIAQTDSGAIIRGSNPKVQ